MAARRGGLHHKAKLTAPIVRRMRRQYAAGGVSIMQLCEEIDYLVEEHTLRDAIRGITWGHIPGAVKR